MPQQEDGLRDGSDPGQPGWRCPKERLGTSRNNDMWVWSATQSSPIRRRDNATVVRPGRS
jgi:hypothetical protein